MPLVSVITPYYNGGKHICQTCNCVLDQTFPWFEWIIVNDGSTNREDVELLQELEKQDPRIRVLHKENSGISSARNLRSCMLRGFSCITGKHSENSRKQRNS